MKYDMQDQQAKFIHNLHKGFLAEETFVHLTYFSAHILCLVLLYFHEHDHSIADLVHLVVVWLCQF